MPVAKEDEPARPPAREILGLFEDPALVQCEQKPEKIRGGCVAMAVDVRARMAAVSVREGPPSCDSREADMAAA